MFIDTHVVSYARKGLLGQSLQGANISSIAASELLLVYGEKRTAANYYVALLSNLHPGVLALIKEDPALQKRATDQIVFDFGSDYEALVEFGSLAIANMVNQKNIRLLQQSIDSLEKGRQKTIREDFSFLIENDIRCVPLNPTTVRIGYRLLDVFGASGEQFKTTFRNTWNDLLILATAWAHKDELWTHDNQLNRFAASSFGEFTAWICGLLKIRFPEMEEPAARRVSGESKRYLNRGWLTFGPA